MAQKVVGALPAPPFPNPTGGCGATHVICQKQTPCPNWDTDCDVGGTCGQLCSDSHTTRRCTAACTGLVCGCTVPSAIDASFKAVPDFDIAFEAFVGY